MCARIPLTTAALLLALLAAAPAPAGSADLDREYVAATYLFLLERSPITAPVARLMAGRWTGADGKSPPAAS